MTSAPQHLLQRSKMLDLYGELHDRLSDILEEVSAGVDGSTIAPEDCKWLSDRLAQLSTEWYTLEKLEAADLQAKLLIHRTV